MNATDHSTAPDQPDSSKRNEPNLVRAWLLIVITPLLLLAVTTVAIFIMVFNASGDRSVIQSELGDWFPYIAMVNHSFLFLLAVWFARRDGWTLLTMGWKQTQRGWIMALVLGLLAGAAIYAFQVYLCEPVVYAIRDGLELGSMRPAPSGSSLRFNVSGLIAGTLFAGIVEETVFRGYLQRQLGIRYGRWTGVLIATLAFTVGLHWGLGPWGLIVVFFNGLLLALLFEWRRNLLTCAVAHGAINAMVVIL